MIESELESETKGSVNYPVLMEGPSGLIVLFQEARVGTVLEAGETGHKVAKVSLTWSMESFSLFPGSIKLKNKEV
jgi:hypothetical protein